jgi:hypothetical protein
MPSPPPRPSRELERQMMATATRGDTPSDVESDIESDVERVAKPTILVVTPEITYLPEGMGNMAQRLRAKAGGMADVSASLVSALYDQGADVHVALPNYRRM